MNSITCPHCQAEIRNAVFLAPRGDLLKPADIFTLCCTYFQEPPTKVASRSRKPALVLVRFIYFLIARRFTKGSQKDIAALVGRGHTNVITGLRTLHDLMDTDAAIRADVANLTAIVAKMQQVRRLHPHKTAA